MALTTPKELVETGLAAPARLAELERVAARYAVAVTPPMAELVAAEPEGPLARQFVPDGRELDVRPEELADPIGDEAHSPVEGLVHRYPDRVLWKLTPICAVYCRFCFRREMVGPGKGRPLSSRAMQAGIDYIASHPAIWEVILSGGDPLVLSPRRLGEAMAALATIAHVKVVRVHTRIPAVAPDVVTDELIAALKRGGKTTYVALHTDHPDELTEAARGACAKIVDAGVPMLGQTVLLKGVNDDPDTLERLMRSLVEMRVKPYYLHHGDLAPGTGHFRTSVAEGQALMRELRRRASGLCQPAYMLDIPGGAGKVPIGPRYLSEDGIVESPRGETHAYPEEG